MTPRKPVRGAKTNLGHLRKPCRDKSEACRPIKLADGVSDENPLGTSTHRQRQGLGCGGNDLVARVVSSVKSSNQKG